MGGSSTAERRFRQLFDEHYRALVVYFQRRIDADDAYDAADDVFLVAWRKLDDVPVGAEALPWLYGVARRVASNRHRSVRRSARLVTRLMGLGSLPPPDPAVKAKFDEIAYLEKSIGKTGQLAISPFLHTSNRDLWQLHMLGQN